tara:strand:+ start:1175 stop:1528 length:354 start_codon:yes stop_codon:yes gene_type:complete
VKILSRFRCHWGTKFTADEETQKHWIRLFKKVSCAKILTAAADHFLLTSNPWPPTPAEFYSQASMLLRSKDCWKPDQMSKEQKAYAVMCFERQLSESQLSEYRANMRKLRNKSAESG